MSKTALCGRCGKDDYAHMWNKAGHRFQCPKCKGTSSVVENYHMMWHDGDVVCGDCGLYIRSYDAG